MKNKKIIIISIIFSILVIGIFSFMLYIQNACNATQEYNKAVREYNHLIEEYNDMTAWSSVDNISGIPAELIELQKVDDSYSSVLHSCLNGNSIQKINNDTETIQDMISEIDNYMIIMQQIHNPSERWVSSRLRNVEEIDQIYPATPVRDPNHMLHEEGGYTAAIYFSINGLDTDSIWGSDPIDKGTDGGGSIEIYENINDAINRCEYLAGFDGTVLYTGSYALIGSIVIRTSFLLSDEEQFELTDKIINEFTKIDE